MNQNDRADIRKAIRAMWEQKLDTVDMAKVLQVPEAEIERHLHIALDRRRAVITNLVSLNAS